MENLKKEFFEKLKKVEEEKKMEGKKNNSEIFKILVFKILENSNLEVIKNS